MPEPWQDGQRYRASKVGTPPDGDQYIASEESGFYAVFSVDGAFGYAGIHVSIGRTAYDSLLAESARGYSGIAWRAQDDLLSAVEVYRTSAASRSAPRLAWFFAWV